MLETEEKLNFKSPDGRYRIRQGRTENQPRSIGTHVWRHKCIKGPICNNIGPTEIWCKYQYLSYLRNKYSYSGQDDDRRINLFWRWRHFLIKYSEITLNRHQLNTDTQRKRTVSFVPMKSGYIFAKFNPQDTTPVPTTNIFLCPESINSINPTLQTLLIFVLSMSEYLTVKSNIKMRMTFQRFFLVFFKPTIMDKSLGSWLLRFWGVFQFTQVQSLPSPHKQCWTCVSRIFSEF